MNNIFFEATKATPKIEFENNVFKVSGQSYPENALQFYAPIFDWLATYLNYLDGEALFEFNLVYLNTSSSKCIMDIIEMLEEAYTEKKKVGINWYYDVENESLLECAEEFKEDMTLPFNIIPLEG